MCYLDMGEAQMALKDLKQSVKMFNKLYKINHRDLAKSLENLGTCYRQLGQPSIAIKFYL